MEWSEFWWGSVGGTSGPIKTKLQRYFFSRPKQYEFFDTKTSMATEGVGHRTAINTVE
jgi:hypothetical protein